MNGYAAALAGWIATRLILAFAAVALLAGACGGCMVRHFDTKPVSYTNAVPSELIGGESWRVLGTTEVTDDLRERMLAVGEEVAECVGLRIFITSGAFVRDSADNWYPVYGFTTLQGRDAIYLATNITAPVRVGGPAILRRVTRAQGRSTLRHEFVHFHTRLKHTEEDNTKLNVLLSRCAYG